MAQTPNTNRSWNTTWSTYAGENDDRYSPQLPLEEVEEARLRPISVDEFPWASRQYDSGDAQFAPIRNAATKEPPKWFQEAQGRSTSRASHRSEKGGGLNRYGSTRSQRSTRSGPRESIVDLHLLVSDLDFYAGAVHDFQEEEEEEEWLSDSEEYELEAQSEWPLPQGSDGATYGQISIQRNISTRSKKSMKDPDLVTWDGPDDPENPKNWTRKRKWAATAVVSLFTFISPVSSSMIAPALEKVKVDLGASSLAETNLAMSIFVLAFAVGPLFLGPLSELYGRAHVLQLSNMFYFAFNLACGFSTNIGELIAFRFLAGLGGSAPLGLGAGVLADIWLPAERGKAIGMYSLAPLLGPAIGPIAGGFIAKYASPESGGWRWVFYSTSIMTILVQILGLFFLKETYEAELLKRKKKKLIKATGNTELHTQFDNPNRKFRVHLGQALIRPLRMLTTQPIVIVLALYIGYVYGVLYLVLASFPVLWSRQYHEDAAIGGLNYISLGLGFFIGTQIAARINDKIYRKLKAENEGVGRSEFRVPLMVPGSILVPVGIFIYGWSAQYKVFWLVPNIGTAIFAAGNQIVFQCCQTYIVDAYTRYAASAIAATTVLRSLGGFGFPLFAQAMYDALGYGWGNSVLGFAGVALGVPMPFFLWFFGAKLRAKSTFAAG